MTGRWLEILKAITLAFLVALSVVLSYWLWMGPVYETDGGGAEPPPPLMSPEAVRLSLLGPERIIVHLGQDKHTVVYPGSREYERLWQAALHVLASMSPVVAEAGTGYEISGDALRRARAGTGMELVFHKYMPAGDWLALWGFAAEGFPAGEVMTNRLAFFAAENVAVYVKDGPAGGLRPLGFLAEGAAGLAAAVEEVAEKAPPDYFDVAGLSGVPMAEGTYVPVRPPQLPLITCEDERPVEEYLASLFFEDIDVVRRIVERDGAIIFTDGRRAVRYYPDGRMEYTAPVYEREGYVPDLLTDLAEAHRFIAQHGGWPAYPYLYDFRAVSRGDEGPAGFEFRFAFHLDGFSVVGDEVPVTVTVLEGSVTSYSRKVRLPLETRRPERLSVGFERLLGILEERGESLGEVLAGSSRVVDLYLAYHPGIRSREGEVFYPVWVVERADMSRLYVNLYSGVTYEERSYEGR